MNYEWKCPDCKAFWGCSTTGGIEPFDSLECGKCGRVSEVKWITKVCVGVEQTDVIKSPTQMEKLEKLKVDAISRTCEERI